MPGASSAWNSAGPLSFFRCILSGTAAHFDDYGYLFTIEGVNAGSGHFYDTDMNDGKNEETLKISVNGVDKYITLCSTAS